MKNETWKKIEELADRISEHGHVLNDLYDAIAQKDEDAVLISLGYLWGQDIEPYIQQIEEIIRYGNL